MKRCSDHSQKQAHKIFVERLLGSNEVAETDVTILVTKLIRWSACYVSIAFRSVGCSFAPASRLCIIAKMTAELEQAIERSQTAVQQQGDIVRALKANVKIQQATQVQTQ